MSSGNDIRELATTCGEQIAQIIANNRRWSDPTYRARMDTCCRNIDALHFALKARGEDLEAYGWTVSRSGEWARVGCIATHGIAPAEEMGKAA